MIGYIIKECLVFLFYFAIIYNIIFSVILSKRIKKKKRKNKKHQGGGVYNFIKGFFLILQCIISLGFVCNKKWFEAIKTIESLPLRITSTEVETPSNTIDPDPFASF
jgi:hypothetical protein|tara:strand:+ start:3322 stop:3642 length:321 start_codon:yes stop_codon:yes gene_type:complete